MNLTVNCATKPAVNLLALDIAFGAACACITCKDGRSFALQTESARPHSQAIMPLLEKILGMAELSWNDLQWLACGIGPGSFTGLRIAAATIAGINSRLLLPVLEISSLAISAAQIRSEKPIHIVEDARSGMAYVGHYQGSAAVEKDACLAWSDIADWPVGIYSAQQSDERLAAWQFVPAIHPRPEAMAQLLLSMSGKLPDADTLPRTPKPAYINPSQAERHAGSVN